MNKQNQSAHGKEMLIWTSWTTSRSEVTSCWTMIGSGSTFGWTNSSSEVISCWTTLGWGSTFCWTTSVTISLSSLLVSPGNCKGSTSVADKPVIVGVIGIAVCTDIGDSSKLDEELEVCDVLDSIKWDCFRWLGVASGGKGGLLSVLHERWGKGWFYSMVADWFYYKKK